MASSSYYNRFSILASPRLPRRLLPLLPRAPQETPLGHGVNQNVFKLLQAIHHGEILDEAARRGSPPPGMARKVQFLTSFIKPAAPNCHTLKLVEDNTGMWLQRNLEILKTHYSDLLTVLSADLPPFRSDAFDRAIIWARKRYHNKLTPSSISALHSLLNSSDPPPSTPLSRFHLYHCHRDPADCLPNTLTLPSNIPCLLSLSFPHQPPYHRPPPRPCGKDAPPPIDLTCFSPLSSNLPSFFPLPLIIIHYLVTP
ncbi:hypothetical protein CesoFtcFv8_000158 [Champsocephalus esox]|uniref:Uncharacterized protein n=1 Tax=Champsocephalus esox TaxID=159716 RepID=A0AAN8E0C5_9TELE|nr:hypothetical protein CesoFtcFv8_000158 [Champsocephalus esox]